jgi:hypothetical protein
LKPDGEISRSEKELIISISWERYRPLIAIVGWIPGDSCTLQVVRRAVPRLRIVGQGFNLLPNNSFEANFAWLFPLAAESTTLWCGIACWLAAQWRASINNCLFGAKLGLMSAKRCDSRLCRPAVRLVIGCCAVASRSMIDVHLHFFCQ